MPIMHSNENEGESIMKIIEEISDSLGETGIGRPTVKDHCESNSQTTHFSEEQKQCEVNIHFKIPKDKMKHIFNARDELAKAGIRFDTGGSNDGEFLEYDWEFDWSLRGGIEVYFKRFKGE